VKKSKGRESEGTKGKRYAPAPHGTGGVHSIVAPNAVDLLFQSLYLTYKLPPKFTTHTLPAE